MTVSPQPSSLDPEIAARLFISPVTVRFHISSILKKLQVPDRAAAIRLLEGDPGP